MSSELDGNLELFETVNGDYWLPKNSEKDIVCQEIKRGKIFDWKIVEELKKIYISTGDPSAVMLDVGANFGQMSIEFAKFKNLIPVVTDSREGRENPIVYAFEAEPFVSKVLRLNIEANKLTEDIVVVDKAVWSRKDESISFPEPDFISMDSWGSYGLDPQKLGGGRMVHTVTIDSMNIQRPIAFIKIDIQGSDLEGLKGARQTITRHRMPIIFEYEEMFASRFSYSFQDYVNYVNSIDYNFEKVIENNYLIVSRR